MPETHPAAFTEDERVILTSAITSISKHRVNMNAVIKYRYAGSCSVPFVRK